MRSGERFGGVLMDANREAKLAPLVMVDGADPEFGDSTSTDRAEFTAPAGLVNVRDQFWIVVPGARKMCIHVDRPAHASKATVDGKDGEVFNVRILGDVQTP